MIVADGYDRKKLAHALEHLMEGYSALAPTLSQGAIATAREPLSEHAVRERWNSARTAMETRLPSGRKRWVFTQKNRTSGKRPELAEKFIERNACVTEPLVPQPPVAPHGRVAAGAGIRLRSLRQFPFLAFSRSQTGSWALFVILSKVFKSPWRSG